MPVVCRNFAHTRRILQPFSSVANVAFIYHLPSREEAYFLQFAKEGEEEHGEPKSTKRGSNNKNNKNSSSSNNNNNNRSKCARQCRMYFAIFLDFAVVTLIVQGLVIGAGYLIWFLDANKVVAQALGESVNCIANDETQNDYYCNHVGSIYYCLGFFIVTLLFGTVFLGYGFIANATDDDDDYDAENPLPNRRAHQSHSFYRRRQERKQERTQSNRCSSALSDGCCLGPCARKVSNVFHNLKHDARIAAKMTSRKGICGSCCGCHDSSNSGSSSDHSCHHYCNCSGCTGEGMLLLLAVCLVTVILVLSLSGFLAIVIILVIVLQRIVQRHYHFMHRRRLVQDFPVIDLSPQNDGETLENNFKKAAPSLTEADTHSLRKLGLDFGEEDEYK